MTGARDLSCRVVAPGALSAAERRQWSAWLKGRERTGGAFLSWQFAGAVAEAYPAARVAILEDASGPVAFLGFQPKEGILGTLGVCERLGGGISDYFGLVAPDGFRISPEVLLRLAGIGALEFSHLDESQTALGLTGDAPRIGLRIDLPEGGGAYLADLRQRKKSVVRETDRRLRRLAEQVGPVRLEIDLRGRPDALDRLIDAKLAQYARTGAIDGAMMTRSWVRRLLHGLYRLDDPDCRGQLSALYAGDVWVASHIGLRAGDVLHYWFPVYNPELASYGPGRLLLQQIIEQAGEHGIACIDRGEGDNPTKREYATSEHRFYRGLWAQPTLRGHVAGLGQRLSWKLAARRAAAGAKAAGESSK